MEFDLFHVHGVFDAWHLIHFSYIVQENVRLNHTPCIRFEIDSVHLIKPHKCNKKPNVGESDSITSNVSLCREDGLYSIKRIGQLLDRLVVRRLSVEGA